ncbi:MAG: hypothetical protein RI981_604 [Bacteroidota bacterium]|jgi:hypothetical protein
MNPLSHRIYLATMTAIVLGVSAYLAYSGYAYYQTPIEERFYQAEHAMLKPSGPFGHGYGIVGTLMMIIGVFGYQARKYMRSLARIGVLKHWLEFHIFLCTLGPILVLFHTSFKFGGLVSISFWSMVAVVASGVAGRFIYLQIPRTIQGRELGLHEIHEMKGQITQQIQQEIGEELMQQIIHTGEEGRTEKTYIQQVLADWRTKSQLRARLKTAQIQGKKLRVIMKLVGQELTIQRRIIGLQYMQKLFKYWHVIHLPFAIIMLVIMLIHVAVTLIFGYRWIF